MAMMLSLSDEELMELRQALELHLTRLEQELSRTEDREFREALRRTSDRLEAVRHRLAVLESPAYVEVE
jgi:uncharacterized UPF0160 family protein